MTRQSPKTWLVRSCLAICVLVVAWAAGCNLNQCADEGSKTERSDEAESTPSAGSVQTAGFISFATTPADSQNELQAIAPPPGWLPEVQSQSDELRNLPPIDSVPVDQEAGLPLTMAPRRGVASQQRPSPSAQSNDPGDDSQRFAEIPVLSPVGAEQYGYEEAEDDGRKDERSARATPHRRGLDNLAGAADPLAGVKDQLQQGGSDHDILNQQLSAIAVTKGNPTEDPADNDQRNYERKIGRYELEAAAEPTTPTPTDVAEAKVEQTGLHPVATGVPTGAKINQRAAAKIRHGYALAQRGAYYTARAEFIGVLRMLAQGKDHLTGKPRRSTALAAGLRALDEAADFAPSGGLGPDVDLRVITSSHRTPIPEIDDPLLPQQLMGRYFRYAQVQLGAAVAGEPAGSMALHALGKLHSQLGRVEPEQHPLAARLAYSYQQAALLAHNQNHLAAHELGVLMAEAGYYAEAENLLSQVAAREPHPQVLKNLARVQEELGRVAAAAQTNTTADQMRSRYGSTSGIEWVDPAEFLRTGRPQWREQPVAARPQGAQQPR